jgi:hypothetical protein
MAKIILSQLQSRFGLKPTAITLENFSDMPALIAEFLKDGGTPADLQKEFGEFTGMAYETLAKEGSFYLKPLLSGARDEFEASVVGKKEGEKDLLLLRAKLVSLCWCKKNGEAMGSPKQLGGQMRSDLINDLFVEAQDMNGIGPKDVDEAGED